MRTLEDGLRSLKKYLSLLLDDDWEIRLAREEGTFRRPYAKVGLAGDTLYPTSPGGPLHNPDIIQPFALSLYPVAGVTPEAALFEAVAVEEAVTIGFLRGGGPLPSPGLPVAAHADGGVLTGGTKRYVITAQDREGRNTLASPAVQIEVVPGAQQSVALSWAAVGGASSYGVWRGGEGVEALLARTIAPAFTDTGALSVSATATLPVSNLTRVGAPRRVPLWDYDDVALDAVASERGVSDFMRVSDVSIGRSVDSDTDLEFVVSADLRLTWRRGGMADDPGALVASVHIEQVAE